MEHICPLCENKDQISELQGLRNRFLEKLEKIKKGDGKLLEPLSSKDSSKSELEDILMSDDSKFKIIAKIDICLSKIRPAYH